MLKSITSLAALACACLSLAAPAVAQDAPNQMHVRTAGLDLSTPAGLTQLQKRMDRSIKVACWSDNREIRQIKAAEACRVDLQNAATVKIAAIAQAHGFQLADAKR